jgi:2-oxoglutarate dehydrogenase E1 component
MTDQSPNAAFHAEDFMDGANAAYIDQLAARHAADPGSSSPTGRRGWARRC